MPKQWWVRICLLVLVWRVCLFGIGGIADHLFSYAPSFPYADVYFESSALPRWLYSWANFDGVHYITIALKGYKGYGLIQAFFPMYPYLILHSIEVATSYHINTILLGLFVSNAALIGAALFFFDLVKKQFSEKSAWLSLFVMLLFPTSFFFGAMYTESLFLLFVFAAFWAAQRQKWLMVAVMISAASATRLVGIMLVPALLIELWQQKQFTPTKAAYILSGSFGLIGFMAYLFKVFDDPLYFLHVQSGFGAGRSEKIVLYPQVLWRALKILNTARPINWKYFSYVEETFASTASLFLMFLGIDLLKLPWSWWIFSLGAFLLPTLSGTFSSMPRYVLVCFPLFIFLAAAIEKYPKLAVLWYGVSLALLVMNTMLFIQGYWVA